MSNRIYICRSSSELAVSLLLISYLSTANYAPDFLIKPCGNCTCTVNQTGTSADCSNKNLKNIPDDLPSNIEELNLSSNEINLEGSSLCRKYPKLKKVYLGWNRAKRISKSIFQGCHNLRELNLAGNTLESFDSSATHDLEHLEALISLEVVELGRDAFKNLRRLVTLDLTWHGIILFPGVFRDLWSLSKLTLSLQKAIVLPEQLFDFGTENSLITLELRGSRVKSFPANLLGGLNKLKHLHLNLPSLLKLQLNEDKKPKNLKTLEIFSVISVHEKTLFGLNSLKTLRLHGIRNLREASLFQQAESVKELEIVDCPMNTVPRGWLDNLISLEMLNLSENGLEMLDPADFTQLKSLKDLVLSGNKIKELPSGVLSPMQDTLQQFLINNNQLEDLGPGIITEMEKLQVIDLSHNNIKHVASTALSQLTQLQQLHLEGNYIQTLDENIFETTPSLQVLSLAENVITVFPEAVLRPAMTYLTLSNNGLTELPAAKLCKSNSLRKLEVSDNPILCDCGLRSLKTCRPTLTIDGKCSGPGEVEGNMIADLKPCRTTTSTTTATTTTTTSTTTTSTTTTTTTTTPPASIAPISTGSAAPSSADILGIWTSVASSSASESKIVHDEQPEEDYDIFTEIVRPLVDTDLVDPHLLDTMKKDKDISDPNLLSTMQKDQDIALQSATGLLEAERLEHIGTSPTPSLHTSEPTSKMPNMSNIFNVTISESPAEENQTQQPRETFKTKEKVVSGNTLNKAEPKPAKIIEGKKEGYLSKAGNITLAIFVSLALMVGVLTGVWLYKKNGLSGYTSYQEPGNFIPMHLRAQQSHPPNQKRSNTTRENRN